LDRSLEFYREVVGLALVARLFGGRAAMLSGGRTHHELLLIQVGEAPGPLRGRRIGLYHVGWKVGEELDALRAARDRALGAGVQVDAIADHTVSQSLYLRDPDGNEVELYVDDPSIDWRRSTEWAEDPVKPLSI
jgi:catechol 2,3-dioxygenase